MSWKNNNGKQLAQLQATVMSTTVKTLARIAKELDLSIGEVIDRLVLNRLPKDADYAALLLLEQIRMLVSSLTDEQKDEAICKMITEIAACMSFEDFDQIQQRAEELRPDNLKQQRTE